MYFKFVTFFDSIKIKLTHSNKIILMVLTYNFLQKGLSMKLLEIFFVQIFDDKP